MLDDHVAGFPIEDRGQCDACEKKRAALCYGCAACGVGASIRDKAESRSATVREIAEAGESLIVTMKDKGSVASWLTIPLGTAPKPGKKEILDALWALLKEGAPE